MIKNEEILQVKFFFFSNLRFIWFVKIGIGFYIVKQERELLNNHIYVYRER